MMVMMKITWHCFLRSHCGHNFCDPDIKKKVFFPTRELMSYNLKVMKMTSMIAVAFLLFLCSTTRCWSLISDFSKNKSDNIWQLGSAVMARSSVFNVFFTKRNIAHLWNPILGALFLVIHCDPEKTLLSVPVLETWVRPRTDLGSVGCLFHTWCLTFSTRLPSIKLCKDLFRFILVFWFDRSSICKRVPIGEKYTNKTHRPKKYNK